MICDCKNAIMKIISVERVKWKACSFDIDPREYSALTFRIKGNAKLKVFGKTHFVGANEILYLPQGLAYTAEYDDNEILAIHFKTQTNDSLPEIYSLSNTDEVYQAFLRASTYWKNKSPGYEAYVLSQLYYILGKLCNNEITVKMPDYFVNAISYINANYTDSTLCAQKICKNSGIGATSLRLLFKKYYQKTPTEYITQLRLEYARTLISCGESISQAAEKSGFTDSKYFARVVKKYYHCTPRELKSYGK